MAGSHWGHNGAILDSGNTDKSERRPMCVVCTNSISLHVVGYERSPPKYVLDFIQVKIQYKLTGVSPSSPSSSPALLASCQRCDSS
jgi:hypothetical protein